MSADHDLPPRWRWVLLRLAQRFLYLLVFGIGLYWLHNIVAVGLTETAITGTILFGAPYALGALITFVGDLNGDRSEQYYSLVPIALVLGVLVVGGIIVREGLICIVLLAPIWIVGAYAGTESVQKLHKKFADQNKLNAALIASLPLLILMADVFIPQQSKQFIVQRTITINASAEEIWPHLIHMENIQPTEGRWNIAQNVFQIPRPTLAIVVDSSTQPRRLAKWGDDISFEEHITDWTKNKSMTWKFVFPNDSVHKHTDEHISPDGRHLKIEKGGYELTPLEGGRTKLTLHTSYTATTPVNWYSAIWGEVFLGGIQANVLEIVKTRAEP